MLYSIIVLKQQTKIDARSKFCVSIEVLSLSSSGLARKTVCLMLSFLHPKLSQYTKTFPNLIPVHLLVIVYSQSLPEVNRIKIIAHSIFHTSYSFYAESDFTTISTDDCNQNDL